MTGPRFGSQTDDAQRLRALQLAIVAILDRPLAEDHLTGEPAFAWSVQGLGMLRLYIRNLGRLHIWDSALAYPNVSAIHTHSWDLHSVIVAGVLQNTRYREFTAGASQDVALLYPHWRQRLVAGYDTRMVSDPEVVFLEMGDQEAYVPGDTYRQRASEIHRTKAIDGTVTLMERQVDIDGQADVYWPTTCTWGTAKPRPATPAEVTATVDKALGLLTRELDLT